MRRRASSQSTRRVSCAHTSGMQLITPVPPSAWPKTHVGLHICTSAIVKTGSCSACSHFEYVCSRLNASAKQDIKHLDFQWLGQNQGPP